MSISVGSDVKLGPGISLGIPPGTPDIFALVTQSGLQIHTATKNKSIIAVIISPQ